MTTILVRKYTATKKKFQVKKVDLKPEKDHSDLDFWNQFILIWLMFYFFPLFLGLDNRNKTFPGQICFVDPDTANPLSCLFKSLFGMSLCAQNKWVCVWEMGGFLVMLIW